MTFLKTFLANKTRKGYTFLFWVFGLEVVVSTACFKRLLSTVQQNGIRPVLKIFIYSLVWLKLINDFDRIVKQACFNYPPGSKAS